ncbi:ATP-dependent protease ATPase subunit HslU [Carnobacterium maltaromaticum]|jgi:ATP-dependent HslUV protease ATP-binding subunit HslU|uniref:ATP-dependent protease ATPase subunit HslU n=3 Tax=Carnobacterium TaxID=2747 RepID=K8E411_CARML|nr:ATP-dependent protease ATP-binding subunit [Carnobacterium maltaromaticum DSM 20342]KRN74259.1 ATP-dependent protease ATP-binding subunit [Carnobacterium maltaromaticum]CCO11044.2 heat shock protein HslVU, ATPase subunit HslU [Carnobacterium maltaromaticum LMA28]MBC9809110.1 ATP-dependent protease ATPase subunit HslU [Carnobacterium maltaromaticum]CAD5897646.1 two-component ATP-dependent protease (ATPase and chaperone) [Carnobacterium maltaromaticum]
MMNTNMQMTPKEIVAELDKYIIGQHQAKKSVAVALRNRYRRMQLDEEMQREVTPKNMLMIGPTGVGKTEIARRLAQLVQAPFVKVEATKFTEVGYVGRDVESMVRDLVENAIKIVEKQQYSNVYTKAENKAVERLAKLLVPGIKKEKKKAESTNPFESMMNNMGMNMNQMAEEPEEEITEQISTNRKVIAQQIRDGLLDQRELTVEVEERKKTVNSPMNAGLEQMGIDLNDTLGALTPKRKVKRTVTVKEALELFIQEESSKLVNPEDIHSEAIRLAQNTGIIFIDEIDKITSKAGQSGEVSREGVQRDILPIVEGSQVSTKYGTIQTDHILFVASGAFHVSKPSDLIPELQGRFPIRVELDDLDASDFVKILTEPNNALVKQYVAMLGTENINVTFTFEAIERLAEIAYQVNHETDNIGARRLHTILEKLLEDLLFEAPDMHMGDITITESYVNDKIEHIVADKDLSRYIL